MGISTLEDAKKMLDLLNLKATVETLLASGIKLPLDKWEIEADMATVIRKALRFATEGLFPSAVVKLVTNGVAINLASPQSDSVMGVLSLRSGTLQKARRLPVKGPHIERFNSLMGTQVVNNRLLSVSGHGILTVGFGLDTIRAYNSNNLLRYVRGYIETLTALKVEIDYIVANINATTLEAEILEEERQEVARQLQTRRSEVSSVLSELTGVTLSGETIRLTVPTIPPEATPTVSSTPRPAAPREEAPAINTATGSDEAMLRQIMATMGIR